MSAATRTTHQRQATRVRAAASMALCVALLWHTPARGHTFAPALLLLDEQRPGVFALTWRLSDATARGGDAALAPLTPRLPAHCQVTPSADATAAAPGAAPTLIDCRPAGLRGTVISVDGLEASPGDVVVRIAWLGGEKASGVLHRTHNAFAVPGGAPDDDSASVRQTFERYFVLGTQNVLFGFDHLLFVLALLLLVTNTPSLIKTIGAFTVAHSATLALATFGLVPVPTAPVTVLIALSLVLLAVEIARRETGYTATPTLARDYPWVVAAFFGLLHGLGFARALAEIGAPTQHFTLSLLGFNLGVAAGQVGIAAVLAMLSSAWSRIGAPLRWARVAPAYAIGALAVYWTLEQVQRWLS